MRYTILLLTAVSFLFTSCSKKLTYFSKDVQQEYNLTEADLKRVQFYLSEDIVLRKKYKGESTKISDGKIKAVDGSKVEEIVFKKGTPGILEFMPKSNRMAVSFESGGSDKYLMFGPNPKAGGRYILLAKEWNRNTGVISYNGQDYSTTSESAYASLLVDLKNARKISVKRRSADGRVIR